MISNLRRRLQQGDLLVGTMVTLNSPEVTELLAEAGFDWLFLDAEHAPLQASGLQAMLQAAGQAVACVIRVPSLDEAAVKHALDSGAAGVIVPQVHTADQVAQAVQFARYPPAGARGLGVARAQRYGFQINEYFQQANEQTLLVIQAESAAAVRNIDAIVRVPGLDAVLIGPYDLSASLGQPGNLEHADVRQAIATITHTCQRAGMPVGIFGLTAAAVRPYVAQGFRLIVVGVDTVLLGQAARELLHAMKSK